MKRVVLLILSLLIASVSAQSRDRVQGQRTSEARLQERRQILRGFDGGMMVHTGYLSGTLEAIDYSTKGLPFGVGGALRLHLGRHFRVGGEGYVSTLKQRGSASGSLKYGWGGVLADAYMTIGRLQPYLGVTVGGGAMTTLLMFEKPESDWATIDGTLYRKQGFFAVDPFVGFNVAVIGPMHLTFKVDYLFPISEYGLLPHGPRVYVGIIFFH